MGKSIGVPNNKTDNLFGRFDVPNNKNGKSISSRFDIPYN